MQEKKSQAEALSPLKSNQDIPNKRYFAISEAAFLCEVKPHVLRYWEQEFPQLKPSKRRGNRRYYQHKDILMIRRIRELLYDQGFTVEGAKAQLSPSSQPIKEKISRTESDPVVKKIIADLEVVLQNLKSSIEASI